MIFSIDEVNRSQRLLPNLTLGFQMYDSCSAEARALQGTMWILSGQQDPVPNYQCQPGQLVPAIIGDSLSATCLLMARVLGIYRYPQISYSAVVPTLSDKAQFPSFFRTIPSGNEVAFCIARLVLHFGWTWVGVLELENDYGQQGSQIIKSELAKHGRCIAFAEVLPLVYSQEKILRIVQAIRQSSARIIVVICTESLLIQVMEEISRQGISGRVWVANHSWSSSRSFSRREFAVTLGGTIGVAIRRGEMTEFRDHLFRLQPFGSPSDPITMAFWEHAFRCQWKIQSEGNGTMARSSQVGKELPICTGYESTRSLEETILDVDNFRFTYNVYNSVYAIAQALHNLIHCTPGEGPFAQATCSLFRDLKPWQLFHYLKRVRFLNKDGEEVYFDQNGNPPPVFDILNWQLDAAGNVHYVKVGGFDLTAPKGKDFTINETAIVWHGGHQQVPRSVCSNSCVPGFRRAARTGAPLCCFDCVPCSPGEITNQTDSSECFKCPESHWSNRRQDQCVPKTLEFLSVYENLGATLCVVAIFGCLVTLLILSIFIRHRNTPIVKANNRFLSYILLLALLLCFLSSVGFLDKPHTLTCKFRQVAFGTVFTVCVACILAKTLTVVIVFNASKPGSKMRVWVGPKLPNSIAMACSLLQILLCSIWLTGSPPYPQVNLKFNTERILLECNEGSPTAFWLMLGYLGILACVSFLMAFLARKLPDSFNETKYITFSMLLFVAVWLSFIPAYLSTQGKYMVAVEVFAILASSLGLLSCIFFPKCFVILLRPQMNSKGFLLGRKTDATSMRINRNRN
ncbi:extracellular calcium-sensing receptor-like [Ambystoma mexicanum]|uniref:extracellular calcium-sensing receptor-like n=1 Tax=Ambystoma mexicanum TaxID=8296 RepID=UPI0037E9952C